MAYFRRSAYLPRFALPYRLLLCDSPRQRGILRTHSANISMNFTGSINLNTRKNVSAHGIPCSNFNSSMKYSLRNSNQSAMFSKSNSPHIIAYMLITIISINLCFFLGYLAYLLFSQIFLPLFAFHITNGSIAYFCELFFMRLPYGFSRMSGNFVI
jgi:hypothetical protein